ncbi:MAG TPA: DNA gyrase subunit A, partial [Umezawaea sp.]|nr:DNA gyrase subunit A [Umezawaea sp.]
MARRKGPTTKVDPSAFDQAGANVVDNPLKSEIEDSYLEYAYSVIHSRALPDARDGLKPVHRRILYSMNEQGYRPTHAYVKSARVVGDCFVRGALVSTPSGLRPIETIEVGDEVLDPAGAAVPVVEAYRNPASELVRVTWATGQSMVVTPGQRFRTLDDDLTPGWTAARDLAGRLTAGYGGARWAAAVPSTDALPYVRALVLAAGRVVDGAVVVESADSTVIDIAHGWAIGADVETTREKHEDPERHVLTVPGLGATDLAEVLADRTTWVPFLAGLLDAAGSASAHGVVLPATARPFLADLGIRATAHEPGLLVTGADAAALAEALLPWSRTEGLRAVTAPTAIRPSLLPGLSLTGVRTVEPVTRDTTYDIQVGTDEHAFVVEGQVVHNCMGKYHPHGDGAIYDAMVRLAQDFSLNTPLVDGHGNFGSPDDGPAASRYTEARMSQAAMLLVGELGEDTIDFRPNYDGSLQEPSVLPAAFPNLLVNGTSGIAVGMATNMIPHNLGEVVAAARWLITHPTATLDKLMEFVPGPDLPTGGALLGLDEVRKAYETGRGVVRMRAKVEIGPLEGSRGRQAITVTELPYGVGSERIIEKITDEVNKSKRLSGIADVKDLTDRENGIRLVVECKVGVNPQALLADLYRLTPMEQSFGINNLVLVDGQPQTLGLKALLEVFLAHRYDVVT